MFIIERQAGQSIQLTCNGDTVGLHVTGVDVQRQIVTVSILADGKWSPETDYCRAENFAVERPAGLIEFVIVRLRWYRGGSVGVDLNAPQSWLVIRNHIEPPTKPIYHHSYQVSREDAEDTIG